MKASDFRSGWLTDLVEPRFTHTPHRLATSAFPHIDEFGGNALFGAAILVVLLLISFGASAALNEHLRSTSHDVPSALLSFAGVVGSVAGLLLAVVVFGVQFHAERMGRISFLSPFLFRRLRLITLATIVLAVVAANTIVGLMCEVLGSNGAAVALAMIDPALVVIVLALTLWLLHRMIISVGGEFFENALVPSLLDEYDKYIQSDIWDRNLKHALTQHAGAINITFNRYLEFFARDDKSAIRIAIGKRGVIKDLNLRALSVMARIIRKSCEGAEITVGLSIGEQCNGDENLYIRSASDTNAQRPAVTFAPPIEKQIHSFLRQSIRTQAHKPKRVEDAVRRFTDALPHIARHDSVDKFEQALNVVTALVRRRLQHPSMFLPTRDEHDPSLEVVPRFWGADYWRETMNAIVSGNDNAKLHLFYQTASDLMIVAAQKKRSHSMRYLGFIVEGLYEGANGEEIQTELTRRIDDFMDVILTLSEGPRRWDHGTDPATAQAFLPIGQVWIGWCLRLIKEAIKKGRDQDAIKFFGRVRQQRTALEESMHHQVGEVNELWNWLILGEIFAAGWCLFSLQRKQNSNAALMLLKAILNGLPSRERLLKSG